MANRFNKAKNDVDANMKLVAFLYLLYYTDGNATKFLNVIWLPLIGLFALYLSEVHFQDF